MLSRPPATLLAFNLSVYAVIKSETLLCAGRRGAAVHSLSVAAKGHVDQIGIWYVHMNVFEGGTQFGGRERGGRRMHNEIPISSPTCVHRVGAREGMEARDCGGDGGREGRKEGKREAVSGGIVPGDER